jgi:hypothetical protein
LDETVSKLVQLFFGAPLTAGGRRRWPYKPHEAGPPSLDEEMLVKGAAVLFGLLLLSLALALIWPWVASFEIWKVECRRLPTGCPL